jgi:hypothetical protein
MADDNAQEPSRIEELALRAARGGQAEHDALIDAFLEDVVVVPSGTDPGRAAFEPVIVDIEGTPHMLVGDSLRAALESSELAQYAVSMRGSDVVRGLTPGHAILVRTPRSGFAIDESLLDEIRARWQ